MNHPAVIASFLLSIGTASCALDTPADTRRSGPAPVVTGVFEAGVETRSLAEADGAAGTFMAVAADASEMPDASQLSEREDAAPELEQGACAVAAESCVPSTSTPSQGSREVSTELGMLYLAPVRTERAGLLRRFGVVGAPGQSALAGGLCRIALYTSESGYPKNLLTWSFVNAELVEGACSVEAGSQVIELHANEEYGVAVECWQADGQPRLEVTTERNGETLVVAHEGGFGAEFPDPFPSTPLASLSGALNVFLELTAIP